MTVLDVGQGDAVLLRDGSSAVLVDGGGWDIHRVDDVAAKVSRIAAGLQHDGVTAGDRVGCVHGRLRTAERRAATPIVFTAHSRRKPPSPTSSARRTEPALARTATGPVARRTTTAPAETVSVRRPGFSTWSPGSVSSAMVIAQAVLVIAYELWMTSEGRAQPFKPPRRDAPPASSLSTAFYRPRDEWYHLLHTGSGFDNEIHPMEKLGLGHTGPHRDTMTAPLQLDQGHPGADVRLPPVHRDQPGVTRAVYPGTVKTLEEEFNLHKLWLAPDPDKMVAELAPPL